MKSSTPYFIGAGLCVVLVLSFWLAVAIGQRWAEFPYSQQRVVVTQDPFPGGDLILSIDVNRTQLCPNEFYREVYDGTGARISQYQWLQGAKPVGQENYEISIPIPSTARPGPNGAYCFSQSPKCNLLQNVIPFWTPMKCYKFTMLGLNNEPANQDPDLTVR